MAWLVRGFTKTINKDHIGAGIAESWKISHRMKFMTFDQLKELLGDEQATLSIKLDGELVACVYQDGVLETVTNRGTVRTHFPAVDEAIQLLQDHKEVVFMSEQYAVNEHGTPQSYMKAASILRDPDKGQDGQIRLSVFDLISMDGKDFSGISIKEKMSVIDQLFGKGKLIHPAPTVNGGIKEAQDLWNKLDDRGWEGLVVHVGDSLYKVKPILSYDLVVVGIEKSPKFPDRIGAVMAAFIDKESRFRLNGSIGGGFTDAERVHLYEWALRNKASEDEDRIWVDPFKEPLIIEVEAMEVHIKERPVMQFEKGKWVQIEQNISGVFRFPQFLKVRDDKEPKYPDVRLDQLPIKQSTNDRPYEMQADGLEVGMKLRTVSGWTGTITGLMPRSGDGGSDFDIKVRWEPKMFGLIDECEIHPSEIAELHTGAEA